MAVPPTDAQRRHDAAQAPVERFDGRNRRLQAARVPDHVGVGEVADDDLVLAAR